jgi:hypothetical protein
MFADEVTDLGAAETLAAVVRARTIESEAGVDRLLLAVHFVDLYPGPATIPADQAVPGGERSLAHGGPGCPSVAEFAVAEYGVVCGVSPESAAKDIGQALALRHRLPLIWDQVVNHQATAWKARTVATACMGLSVAAAAIVDRRVAAIIDSVGPVQLRNIVKAAMWEADPEAARAEAERKARERGVWIGRSDDHGTSTLFIKAATGDVIRLEATIAQIAEALGRLDPDSTDTGQQRRAKATGILADPALTYQLLQVARYLATHPAETAGSDPVQNDGPADDAPPGEVTWDGEQAADLFLTDEPGVEAEADRDTPHPSQPGHPLDPPEPTRPTGAVAEIIWGMDAAARHDLAAKLAAIKHAADTTGTSSGSRPGRTKLYVHLTDEALLAGGGVTRVEGFGPVLAVRLAELLGHDRIVIQPVIDLNDDHVNVNAYEIPRRIRERVKLTYPVEQFPYGTGETTDHTDLDHVVPFDPTGPPGQTSTANLRPLRRFSHRVKTHAGWKVQPTNDHALEWTTPHGYKFRVDTTGTHPITDDDP